LNPDPIRIRIRNTASKGTKAFLKGGKPDLFVNLINFHAPGSGSGYTIAIHTRIIPYLDPDPDPQNWFLLSHSMLKLPLEKSSKAARFV
jgi:hypothetical protein